MASIDHTELSYRAALLLSRWSRRSRQAQLYQHASLLGREIRLRAAIRRLRSWRSWRLSRWHKRMSAELHRWSSLMRLVLLAWRGWHALHLTAQERRAHALQARADRLCAWCLGGWCCYVAMRGRARHSLLHFATTLQRRCLLGWAAWMAERLRKRPSKTRMAQVAAVQVRRTTWRRWVAAAERHGANLLQQCAAQRLAVDHALEAALSKWCQARTGAVHRALLSRRAYIFMAARLEARIFDAWSGLRRQRLLLVALAPRARARLEVARLRHGVGAWRQAATLRVCASALGASRRLAVEVAAARAGARAFLVSLRARSQRVAQLHAAAEAAKALSTRPLWNGWRRVHAAREAARAAAVRASRGWRRWAGRARRTSVHCAQLGHAVAMHSASLGRRVATAWHLAARLQASRRSASATVDGRRRRATLQRAWRTLARVAVEMHCQEYARLMGERRRKRAIVGEWLRLTLATNAFDASWRRSVRHRYFVLLRVLLRAWRGLLALRHERWASVLEAEARFGKRRRRRALLHWRDETVPVALATALADEYSELTRKRNALPRWRHAAAQRAARARATRAAVALFGATLSHAVLAAWGSYVTSRQQRTAQKAERLEELRCLLAGAVRARLFRAWWAWHCAEAAWRAHSARLTRAVRALRQRRSLATLHVQTEGSRLRRMELRLAAQHAAFRRGRAGWLAWAAAAARRRSYALAARGADLQYADSLQRACWGGWVRYHRRKQHKAAQLREAYASHARRLQQLGAAQWVAVGLARHEAKLEAATARAAERAADSLRRAERFARHWRALTAARKRELQARHLERYELRHPHLASAGPAGASGGSSAHYGLQHYPPGYLQGYPHGYLGDAWQPGTVGWASTVAPNLMSTMAPTMAPIWTPSALPPRLASGGAYRDDATSNRDAPAWAPSPALTLPAPQQQQKPSYVAAEWENLFPNKGRERPAPRPLPAWVSGLEAEQHVQKATRALRAEIVAEIVAEPAWVEYADSAPAELRRRAPPTPTPTPTPTPPPPLPTASYEDQSAAKIRSPVKRTAPTVHASSDVAKPAMPSDSAVGSPASVMVAEHALAEHSLVAVTGACKGGADVEAAAAAAVRRALVEEAKAAAEDSNAAKAAAAARQAAAAARAEMSAIERELRHYSREKDEYAAAAELHDKLATQVAAHGENGPAATRLSGVQRRAQHEALLCVRQKLDAYEAAQPEREQAMLRLVARIEELSAR